MSKATTNNRMPPEIRKARIEMPICCNRKAPAKTKKTSTANEITAAPSASLRCARRSSGSASARKVGSAANGLTTRNRVTNSPRRCCHHMSRPNRLIEIQVSGPHAQHARDWREAPPCYIAARPHFRPKKARPEACLRSGQEEQHGPEDHQSLRLLHPWRHEPQGIPRSPRRAGGLRGRRCGPVAAAAKRLRKS